MRYADMAMYEAKRQRHAQGVYYQPRMNRELQERKRLHDRLQRALEQGELQLHYQPQVDVVSGQIIGAEALLRWTDAELGVIAPDRFIPVAVSTCRSSSFASRSWPACCSRSWRATPSRRGCWSWRSPKPRPCPTPRRRAR
jgi:predicted signal transduction protein with EAL and GGDEF domain